MKIYLGEIQKKSLLKFIELNGSRQKNVVILNDVLAKLVCVGACPFLNIGMRKKSLNKVGYIAYK